MTQEQILEKLLNMFEGYKLEGTRRKDDFIYTDLNNLILEISDTSPIGCHYLPHPNNTEKYLSPNNNNMNMLRIEPVIDVATPLGDGKATFLFDYGLDVNTVWVVRLKGGIVKHFYSDDIRIYDNPMNGDGWDVDIPKTWLPYNTNTVK